MSAPIQIVDEDDNPIGVATKQEAWGQGLLHRIVRIMLENDRGEILLQMRDPNKDIFPACWDNSAAGHVDAGEDYTSAAYRELKEEIGLSGQLTEVGMYRSNETISGKAFNRFTKVYTLHSNARLSDLKLEPHKVTAVKWFPVAEVKQLVAEQPRRVTDGLRQVIERYY